jgi:hypothetical protein
MIIKKFNPWTKVATVSFHDLFPDVQIKIPDNFILKNSVEVDDPDFGICFSVFAPATEDNKLTTKISVFVSQKSLDDNSNPQLDNFIVENSIDLDNPDFDTYISGFVPTAEDINRAIQDNELKSKISVFVSQKSLDDNANLQPALERARVLTGGRFSYTTTNRIGKFDDILYDYRDHDTFIGIIKNNPAVHKFWAFIFNLTDKFLLNQWVKTSLLERYQVPQLPYSIKTTNTVVPTDEIAVRAFFSQHASVIVKPINGYNTVEKSYIRKVYTDADSFLNDVVSEEGNLNRFFTNQNIISYYWKADDPIPVMLQEYFDTVDLDFVYNVVVNTAKNSHPDNPTNFVWLTESDPVISRLLNRYMFFTHVRKGIVQIKGIRHGNDIHLLDLSFVLDPLLSSTDDVDTMARNIIFMYLRD